MFASDNAAGIHPRVLAAIEAANRGRALAYGHDGFTAAANARLREVFGATAEPLLVFGGTGANVLALRTMVDSYQSVVCAASSHVWVDECSAPERFVGKLVPIATATGKLTPDAVREVLHGFGDVHHAQPRAISVAQATEWGTVYRPEELAALAELAHAHDMVLHLDGARLSNAAAALDLPLGAFGRDAGVDVLSFGGTKNGLLGAEAVIFFDPELARRAGFHRKQLMQLASKMRFLAVQIETRLEGELWRELASHANAMARRLGDGLAALPGITLTQPVETNAVFAALPPAAVAPMQAAGYFHMWDAARSIVRLMTAWDTEPAEVDAFLAAARQTLG
ncbi:MAG TPA: beta-eliminating lyase-related protein [Kofleriaceae bacterium]|nr:beta-eliminating lyase-related protein [Kofleriaceae bacterium]